MPHAQPHSWQAPSPETTSVSTGHTPESAGNWRKASIHRLPVTLTHGKNWPNSGWQEL